MSRAETNAPHPRRAVVAVADEDAGRQGGPRRARAEPDSGQISLSRSSRLQRNGAIAEDSIGVYSTFLFVDAFTDVLENVDASTPLFMYLSWQNVHAPLDPPPASFYTKTELSLVNSIEDPHRRTFASITIVLDNAMKKVVGAMKKSGF